MRRLLATAAALLLTLPAAARAQDIGLEIGTQAPAAAVRTLDGKPADLSEFVGKGPVLLEFWATWFPNCRALEPQMQAAARKYAGRVRIVGVAVSVNQSPERVRAYVQKHQLPGTFVFDAKGAATDAYDVPATSYIVVLDRAGPQLLTRHALHAAHRCRRRRDDGGDRDLHRTIARHPTRSCAGVAPRVLVLPHRPLPPWSMSGRPSLHGTASHSTGQRVCHV